VKHCPSTDTTLEPTLVFVGQFLYGVTATNKFSFIVGGSNRYREAGSPNVETVIQAA
jgi:hypothetical protein